MKTTLIITALALTIALHYQALVQWKPMGCDDTKQRQQMEQASRALYMEYQFAQKDQRQTIARCVEITFRGYDLMLLPLPYGEFVYRCRYDK